ncbi:LysE family translocator [Planctobacterium marinum]
MFMFSLSMSLSPGPVNIVSMNMGSTLGFNRALHFVAGATIGFIVQLLLTGISATMVLQDLVTYSHYLRYPGALYMLCLALVILGSKPDPDAETKTEQQNGFVSGMLIQWINPKAWIACVAGTSAFILGKSHTDFALFLLVYFVVCFCSVALWAAAGRLMMRHLQHTVFRRIFNLFLASMLGLCAVALLW